METFVADIHAGRWDLVLSQASSMQLPREKLVCLYEQVVIELLEAREVELAREVSSTIFPTVTYTDHEPIRCSAPRNPCAFSR